MRGREVNLLKRKRSQNSDDEDKGNFCGTRMTEERYRSMLGEHIQKYNRRYKDASPSPVQNRVSAQLLRSNIGLRGSTLVNERRGGAHALESTSEWLNDISPQKPVNYRDAESRQRYGPHRFNFSSLLPG